MSENIDYRKVVPSPELMGTPDEPGPAREAGWEHHGDGKIEWPEHTVTVGLGGAEVVLPLRKGAIAHVEEPDTGSSLYVGAAYGEEVAPQPEGSHMALYLLRRLVEPL